MNPTEPKVNIEKPEHKEQLNKLDDVISQHIKNVLTKTKGKVNGPDGAAAILGVNPSTLRNRMKKLGINYSRRNL